MLGIEIDHDQRIVHTEEQGFEYGYNRIICSELLAPIVSLLNSKGYFVTSATPIHYANKKYYINYDGEKRLASKSTSTKRLISPCLVFANETRRRLYPFFSTLPDPWVCEFDDGLADFYTVLSKEMIESGKWFSLRGYEFPDDDLSTMSISVERDIWIDKNDIYGAYGKLLEMCNSLYQWVLSLPTFPDDSYSIIMNKLMHLSWAVNFDMYNPEKPAGVTFMATEELEKHKPELEAQLAAQLDEYRKSHPAG